MVSTSNKYMATGPTGAQCLEWPCRLIAGSKLLLCSALQGAVPVCGRVENLHCEPASRRRRRKVKSQIWESKLGPRFLRDSDPKLTALAKASSNSKRQTRPLVREGTPNQQTHKCQTIINILSLAQNWWFVPRQTGRLWHWWLARSSQ
jgi:hypothetical protein